MVFTNEILNPGQRVTNEVRPDEAGSVRVEPGQLGVVKGEHTGRVEVPEEYNKSYYEFGHLGFCDLLFDPMQDIARARLKSSFFKG